MANKIEIEIDAKDNASGVLGGVKNALGDVFKTAMGFLTAQVFERIGSAVVDFAKDSIGAASDLNETMNKTSEIFKDSTDAIVSWSKNSAQAVGLSQKAALDAASSFALFGKSAGLSGQQLNDFSTDTVGLAADLASFFNTSVEDASTAISALFRGETEPIRRYNVLVDDAALRQKALALGIVSTTQNALTPQQKILAAQALLFEQTASAQGDFARTSDGLANSQRIFAAQVENAKAQLGTAFLPIVTEVMGVLNTQFIPALQGVIDKIAPFVDAFTNQAGPVIDKLLAQFQNFGSSPAMQSIRETFDFLANWWTINGPGIMEGAQTLFGGIQTLIAELSARFGPFIELTFAKLSQWMIDNGPLIQETVKTIATFFADVLVPAIVQAVDIIMPLLTGLVDIIMSLGTLIMQVITGDWAGAWQSAQDIFNTAVQAIYTSILLFLETIAGYFGTSLAEIGQVWSDNWNMFLEIMTKLLGMLIGKAQEFIQAGLDLAQNFIGGIITGILGGIDGIKNAVGNVVSNVTAGITNAVSGVIPGRASGGMANGLTWVGERGPELIRAPGGSRVYSNSQSQQMAQTPPIDYDRLANAIVFAMQTAGGQ